MKTKTLKFTCPQCGKHEIEEVLCDTTVTTKIVSLTVDEDGEPTVKYGACEHEDGSLNGYQCAACGKYIAEDLDDLADGDTTSVIED